MSIYATFDESAGEQIASNLGWSDLVAWVDELDSAEFPNLVHLADYGWVNELPIVLQELESASVKHPPQADGLDKTLAALADLLKSNRDKESLFVTDGMTK